MKPWDGVYEMDQLQLPQLPRPSAPQERQASSETLKIPMGQDILEITVDPGQPVIDMTNNAVTWILCLCGEHLISSQRQLESLRSWYHVHCPKCGRAGAIPGEVWRKMVALLTPQMMAS